MTKPFRKEDIKIPDDLGIVVTTEEGKAWAEIKRNILKEIAHLKRTLILAEHDLIKVDEMIDEEERKA